jgi:serine/threonine protein kinase
MPLASSIELPDRYRVVRHIASGGMASVWEAEDLLLGRLVAVKVLAPQYAADPAARARFQREARTAAQVSDQTNVMTIYDIGEHGDDAFIVMEHFSGGTVADRLRAARDAGERVPRETALRWLREAAAGLDVAHAAGIVHRDVKPANLLLDANDRLAVGDFGIARLVDDTQMTQTGQVLGTAAYISPEQALGRPASPASDRYALAVVAFELLTGSRPFAGGPPTAQARQHAEAPPTPPSVSAPDLPPALDAVLARGLAKDPAQRPATAAELVAAIESALDVPAAVEPTRRFSAVAASGRPRTTPSPPAPGSDGAAPAQDGARSTPLRPTPPDAAADGDAPPDSGRPRSIRLRPTPPDAEARARRPGEVPANGADTRAGAQASAPPTGPGRLRAPWPALLAVGLLTAAAVGLVLALSGGGAEPRGERAALTRPSPARSEPSATTAAAPQPPPAPPQPAQASSGDASPAALNDRGFALLRQGRFGEAIEPLRAAVAGYRAAGDGGLPYAYALFNLAVALNRSGNPAEAVPLLRERLKFDNQRDTVQSELDNARAKLAPASPGKGKHLGKLKPKKDRDDG